MIKKIDDFKERINDINDILLTASILLEDYKYFFNQNDEMINNVFCRYKKIFRIKISTIRYLNLELLKLINPKESYSIVKLLNILLNDYVDSEWKHLILKTELQDLKNRMEKIQESETYFKMQTLRDKYFAHLDLNRYSFPVEWTPFEIEKIIVECQETMNVLRLKILKSEMRYEFSSIDVGNHLFHDLLKFNQFVDNIQEAYKETNSYFKTETIYNWIIHDKSLNSETRD